LNAYIILARGKVVEIQDYFPSKFFMRR